MTLDVDRLSSIAAQLVGRVRDEDPEHNGVWLRAETSDEERWALLFVLAAAVPDDVSWARLVEWATGIPADPRERRLLQWREASRRRRSA